LGFSTIACGLVGFDFGGADDVAADAVIRLDHLAKRATDHEVVGQNHCERFVPNDMPRAPHRVAKAQWLLLADRDQLARGGPRSVERSAALAGLFHRRLKLKP
jgi:hypothetical protein